MFKFEFNVYSCYDYRNCPKDGSCMYECLECRMMTLDFQSRVKEVISLKSSLYLDQKVQDFVRIQNKSIIIGNFKQIVPRQNSKVEIIIPFKFTSKELDEMICSVCNKLELRLSNICYDQAVGNHQPWNLPCKLHLNNIVVWQCQKNDKESFLNK